MFKSKETCLDFVFDLFEEKDLEACIKMIKASSKNIRWREDFLKNLLLSKGIIGVIARKNGKEVGLIVGSLLVTPQINFICIMDQENILKGLGGMLIDKFLQEVKKHKLIMPYVTVSLDAADTNAVALYSSKGFVVEGFVKRGLRDKDMVLLRKRIAE
jgi:ribosomal protein S18 acetylase RimI-like enzyme